MRKLSIVPFTRRELPVLNMLEREKSFTVESLITPTGIGYEGQDISALVNSKDRGYRFTNELEVGLKESDVVLISNVPESFKSLRDFAFSALEKASQMGKEILCFLNLNETEQDMLQEKCLEAGAVLKLCGKQFDTDIKVFDSFRLFHFDVPVIYVCEEIPNCDGYDVFLQLAYSLTHSGKNVLAISENPYNELFGFSNLEFSVPADARNQIFRINWLIHELECKHHPDLILVYLPRPLMQFDNQNTFDFGATAFLATRALPGDGCIYCTHISATPGNFWKDFRESILTKFGFPIMAVHISNRLIDNTWDDNLATIRVPEQEADDVRMNFASVDGLSFSNLLNTNDMYTLVELIETEFFNLPYGVI